MAPKMPVLLLLEQGATRESTHFAYISADGRYRTGTLLREPDRWHHEPSPLGFRPWLENERRSRKVSLNDPWRGSIVTEHPIGAGEYFPRIWRPHWSPPMSRLADGAFANSVLATSGLIQKLRHLFLTIEPDAATHHVYGHEVRSLLMLACTEVENAWAGVLRANHYPGDRWTRKDYVKLCPAMELELYEVELAWYPGYPRFRPFAGWTASKGKILPWYDAYNATKHNREQSFNEARLEHVIQCMGALIVMLYAQFGPPNARVTGDLNPTWSEAQDEIGQDFRVRFLGSEHGATLPINDFLVPPVSPGEASQWTPVDYRF